MRRALFILLMASAACLGQNEPPAAEELQLRQALEEVGGSSLEFIRAVENHLSKFPQSSQRPELERALVKAAVDAKDNRRLLLYGERVLERDGNDLEILERVSEALAAKEDKESSERALKYAQHYEEVLGSVQEAKPASPRLQVRWQEQHDGGLARAWFLQARANENLGHHEEAAALARRSYQAFPTAEGARELGQILARMGKHAEAVEHLADAFTIVDQRNTEAERAKDRKRMGEIYTKLKGSEAGLGDVILRAYDRTSALVEERRAKLKLIDPNIGVTDPMSFTLTALKGKALDLSTTRGKVVVFDFWATWCGPCRAQHPLIEEVRSKFQDKPEVVFLSVSTDEDHDLVEPFLKENGWPQAVYFEDGLSRVLRVSSIPTMVIANKHGEIVNRLAGFIPERFVDMLTQRIQEALAQ